MPRRSRRRVHHVQLVAMAEPSLEEALNSSDRTKASLRKDVASVRHTELYKLLKSWMTYMELCCVFHVRAGDDIGDENGCTDRRRRARSRVLARCLWDWAPILYITFISIGLCVAVLEYSAYIMEFEFAALTVELIIIGLTLQNLIGVVLMYRYCESGLVRRLFQWYSLLAKDDAEDKWRLDASVVRLMRILLPISLFINIANGLAFHAFVHLTYTRQIDTECFGATMYKIMYNKPIYYYVLVLSAYLVFPPYTLMTGLISIVSLAMSTAFDMVNERLMASIRADVHDQLEEVVDNRTAAQAAADFNVWPFVAQHRVITKMVGVASDVFGVYGLVYFLTNIAISCVMLYMVLFLCPSTPSLIMQAVWLTASLPMAFHMIYQLVRLSNSATASWEHLHALKLDGMSKRHGVYLATFLERISCRRNEIGLSACDFFTATQSNVFLTFTIFVSSFLVLLEFSPPGDFCALSNTTCGRPIADN